MRREREGAPASGPGAAEGSFPNLEGIRPMNKEIRFVVHARLPEKLEVLSALARNLQWSWDHEAIDLFRRIDPDLWDSVGHNPVRLLGEAPQERLEALARDDAFLAHVGRVLEGHARYLEETTRWYRRAGGVESDQPWVAYFSMEFGLAECLPIYSGGLGVLAGDFLKATSDLGVPVVGVGILYQQGYFKQYLNSDGWQQEEYPELDFHNIPVRPCASPRDGGAVVVEVPMGEQIGRASCRERV